VGFKPQKTKVRKRQAVMVGIEFDAAAARVTAQAPLIEAAGATTGQSRKMRRSSHHQTGVGDRRGERRILSREKSSFTGLCGEDEEAGAKVSPKMQVFLQRSRTKYAPAADLAAWRNGTRSFGIARPAIEFCTTRNGESFRVIAQERKSESRKPARMPRRVNARRGCDALRPPSKSRTEKLWANG